MLSAFRSLLFGSSTQATIHPSLCSLQRHKQLAESFSSIKICGNVIATICGKTVAIKCDLPCIVHVENDCLIVTTTIINIENGEVVSCGDLTGYAFSWNVTTDCPILKISAFEGKIQISDVSLKTLECSGASVIGIRGDCEKIDLAEKAQCVARVVRSVITAIDSSSVKVSGDELTIKATGRSDVNAYCKTIRIEALGSSSVKYSAETTLSRRVSPHATLSM